ncbi:MAG: metal-dependent hydrolase [Candidatus Pristimantibacillus sp.]
MQYHTHITTSLAIGTGIAATLGLPYTLGFVSGLAVGSLLPDIDHPKSFLGRRSFGISNIINRKYGHRGMTHSLVTWCSLTIPCLLFFSPFSIGAWLGYGFHIFWDYFSKTGVPLFEPFEHKRFSARFTYKTGSLMETVIFSLACALIGILIITKDLLKQLIPSIAVNANKAIHFGVDLLVKIIKIALSNN